jgi:hypothetical protein
MKHLALAIVVFTLTACGGGGGGGDDSVSDVRPSGIWLGTGGSAGSVGIITEANDLFFINTNFNSLTSGRVTTVSGNDVSGNGRSYATIGNVFPDGTTIDDGTFTSTIVERQSFTGTFSSDLGSSAFTYSYSPFYDRDSSLSAVSGNWSGTDFSGVFTVTIDSNGKIQGSNSDGCIYSGHIGLIDSSYNAYSLSITIFDCGSFDAMYSGVASLDDTSIANDTLVTAVSTPTTALVLPLNRL